MATSLRLVRTDATDPAFVALVRLLDADLAVRDGKEHSFYAQYNTIGDIRHAIVAFHGERPVSIGAIKAFGDDVMEVKRMYTVEEDRGKGYAALVLRELEHWASALGVSRTVLETGKKQPEAIALYKKCGYRIIPNYGQYIGVENSICFEKILVP